MMTKHPSSTGERSANDHQDSLMESIEVAVNSQSYHLIISKDFPFIFLGSPRKVNTIMHGVCLLFSANPMSSRQPYNFIGSCCLTPILSARTTVDPV